VSNKARSRPSISTNSEQAAAPRRITVLVIAGIVGACVVVAGGWWGLRLMTHPASPTLTTVRGLLDEHQPMSALNAVSQMSPLDLNNSTTGGILDDVYAGICDPGTDEPDLAAINPDTRRLARQLLESARNRTFTQAEEVLRAGKFALAAGLASDAVEMTQRARSRNSPDVAAPLGYALLRSGQFNEVLKLSPAEAGKSPHQRAVLGILRGRAQEKLGQFDDARLSMRAALAEEPGNPRVMSRLGLIELTHGDRRDTAILLDRARNAARDATSTLRLEAEYDWATGDFSGSADVYAKLMKRGNAETYDPFPASLGRARALIYAGQTGLAEDALNTAGKLLPDDPFVRYYRALLEYRLGHYGRAVELAQPLDTRLRDFPRLNLLIGAASLANGYYETGAHRLRRYLESEPANLNVQALLVAAEARLANPADTTALPKARLLAAFDFPTD